MVSRGQIYVESNAMHDTHLAPVLLDWQILLDM
jgi:hypothetical protein